MTAERVSLREFATMLGLSIHVVDALIKKGILERPGLSPVSPRGIVEKANASMSELKWLEIVSPENWEMLVAKSLTYTLFPSRVRPWVDVMRPGNELIFYVTRWSTFSALAMITGPRRRETEFLPGGVYTEKVPVQKQILLPARFGVKIGPLINDLQFINSKKHWPMALRRTLILLAENDFALIKGSLQQQFQEHRERSISRE